MLPASPTPGSQAIHTGYRAMTVLTLWRQLSTWGSQECELGSRLVDAGPCHLRHRLMGRSGLPQEREPVRLQRDGASGCAFSGTRASGCAFGGTGSRDARSGRSGMPA